MCIIFEVNVVYLSIKLEKILLDRFVYSVLSVRYIK